jgi:hypothetical protein
MNKRIQTYDDLCEEKQRLEILLTLQREQLREDIADIKEQLTPVTNVFSFVRKVAVRNKSNTLLNFGLDIAGDLLLKKFLLRRAGWLTRLAVPYVVKNYSSNSLAGKKVSLFKTIGRFFIGRKKTSVESKQY